MGKRTVMMELGTVSMMLLVCAAIKMLVIDSKQASGKLERGGHPCESLFYLREEVRKKVKHDACWWINEFEIDILFERDMILYWSECLSEMNKRRQQGVSGSRCLTGHAVLLSYRAGLIIGDDAQMPALLSARPSLLRSSGFFTGIQPQ